MRVNLEFKRDTGDRIEFIHWSIWTTTRYAFVKVGVILSLLTGYSIILNLLCTIPEPSSTKDIINYVWNKNFLLILEIAGDPVTYTYIQYNILAGWPLLKFLLANYVSECSQPVSLIESFTGRVSVWEWWVEYELSEPLDSRLVHFETFILCVVNECKHLNFAIRARISRIPI